MTDGAAAIGTREIRIAAVGDLHFGAGSEGTMRENFARIGRSADILVLCGDLTTHGRPEQMRGFVEEITSAKIPIVAVLGNHDFESDAAGELCAILHDAGVRVLDGDYVELEGIGFAGTKGFTGGFDKGALAPFGERLIKDFVQGSIDEALKLENALRNLKTPVKVVVVHYAPIAETVHGEPEVIYPFLGSSRLVQPIDMVGADVVFHGHAHHGSPVGRTPGGVPVYNVSWPLLASLGRTHVLWTAQVPDRRQAQRESFPPSEQLQPRAERRTG